jgi:hypothetical protein
VAKVFTSGRADRAYFQSNSRANPARHFQPHQVFENEAKQKPCFLLGVAKQVLNGIF